MGLTEINFIFGKLLSRMWRRAKVRSY